jgi:hypothetical protein
MNPNSISTYKQKILPDIKKKHERVVMAMLSLGGTATVYELADSLNTAVHNISGRLTELSKGIEYGRPIIEDSGKRNNKYGNPCTVWKIKQPAPVGEQQKMF